jgi:hypothetical protein
MMLTPRMQKLLVQIEDNGNRLICKEQSIYANPHDFYTDANILATRTGASGHPPWIKKTIQPDRTYMYSLEPLGRLVARCLRKLHKEC